ncbi:hypothetical protein P692DRAFT_20851518 [Suillus brevipes Sb2]|nr:hypothetical protein P692DRAFT_20851518 [Suillus brevipes Sb2]
MCDSATKLASLTTLGLKKDRPSLFHLVYNRGDQGSTGPAYHAPGILSRFPLIVIDSCYRTCVPIKLGATFAHVLDLSAIVSKARMFCSRVFIGTCLYLLAFDHDRPHVYSMDSALCRHRTQ